MTSSGIKKALLGVLFAGGLFSSTASANVLYSNGPFNGTVDGFSINIGVQSADSFILNSASVLTKVEIGAWTHSTDYLTSVQWSIGSAMPGTPGTTYATGTAAVTSNIVFGTAVGPGNTYDISRSTFTLPAIALPAGTYWLTLQNAITAGGSNAYWDINGGPSSAWNSVYGNFTTCGPIVIGVAGRCSNSFEILDSKSGPVVTPEPSTLMLFPTMALVASALRARKRSASRKKS